MGVIFANFRQLGNLPFSNDLLKKTNSFCKEILICLNNFNRNVTLLNDLRDIQHLYFCKDFFFRDKTEKNVCSIIILMLLLGYLDGFSI